MSPTDAMIYLLANEPGERLQAILLRHPTVVGRMLDQLINEPEQILTPDSMQAQEEPLVRRNQVARARMCWEDYLDAQTQDQLRQMLADRGEDPTLLTDELAEIAPLTEWLTSRRPRSLQPTR